MTQAGTVGTNDGSCTNCPADGTDRWGNSMGAASFIDDNSEYIDFNHNIDPQSFSLCLWTKTNATGSDNIMIGGRTGGTTTLLQIGQKFTTTDEFFFSLKLNNAQRTAFSGLPASNDNQWHEICVTSNSNTAYYYLDSVQKATDTTLAPSGTLPSNQVIGGNKDNSTVVGTWIGLIDDVRIYNRALTAEEVAQNYRDKP